MPSFDVIKKRLRINIFNISGAYYFKYFFDDPELSIENYPLRDKMVFVMKDMAWVEQALAMGAVMSATIKK